MALVDVDDVRKAFHGAYVFHDAFDDVIDSVPAIDAVPVVRGKWVTKDKGGIAYKGDFVCSVCDRFDENAKFYAYCPNCGACMKEV